ncbi:restriction endonuclease subunit S [Spiroplasma endosymbiont of Polydrusus pterygomalis]|uniref:restriction endonuclease subunit S n=1 Tax=Spiroplasma endosymbiont of Polydrusus pterygomalis TaxID=3139327 RepID=UPI003CCB2D9C
MNKSLLPKIRFKGFNGEWVLKQIKALGNIKIGKTPSTKNEKNWLNDVLWITIPDMTKKYLTNSKKKISLMASKKNPVVKEKSILFSCIGTIGNIGITTTITSFNQQINSISSIKDVVEYVYYLFQYNTEKIKSYSLTQTLPMINKNYFENIEIFVSLNYKEQNKIADFFTIIDKKIELVKEQLTLLAKQKQYYLNNMFTNEKSYPQIRFRGFINENNFQKVKLRTIATIWGGSTPSTKNKKLWLNEIPFITPNFITKNNSMLLNKYDRFITDKNFNFSNKNDILLTCRAPVGVVTINNLEKCWFSQGIKNIRTGKLINHKYLYYWLYNNKNVLITNSFGTTFLEISNKDLENIQIYITCSLQEQTKIAHFFSIIDRKIELVKEQLSLLVKQKQYYLNNMFI